MSTDRPAENSTRAASDSDGGQYVVVARRYRPKSFEELVGQSQVSQALAGAINTNRVGHAYLFTGARGVGKTSTARILAKALNCVEGPSPTPCNTCDICQRVSTGDDVDVLEIDGASNRGIDEIRQLRSNVNVRPSRARYKIYIIDEVHMLTAPAFNALLKTLEEPPEHVKFIFCTTDPEKIPITVLSRCQRFDFPPVETASIVERLKTIVVSEGREAEADALQLLARRANGSMRDSQSLLEQLLAFSPDKITVEDVHAMLGTVQSSRLAAIALTLMRRDAAGAIAEFDAAVGEGADVGQLTEQLMGYFRDLMAVAVGCDASQMLNVAPGDFADLKQRSEQFGVSTIMAAMQILDETLVRMRQSTHGQMLAELALVRICNLAELDELAGLVSELRSGTLASNKSANSASPTKLAGQPTPTRPTPDHQKKNAARKIIPDDAIATTTQDRPTPEKPLATKTGNFATLDPQEIESLWQETLRVAGDTAAGLGDVHERIAILAPNRLVVSMKAAYTFQKERWERPDTKQRLESAFAELAGHEVRIDFELVPGKAPKAAIKTPVKSKLQQMREVESHSLVREAIELFDAEIVDIQSPRQDG